MTDWLARAIDSVRVNHVARTTRDGVAGFDKTRRRFTAPVVAAGNAFLSLSRSRITMLTSPEAQRGFEAASFALLHPNRRCVGVDARTVFVERLPGQSLRELAAMGDLDAASMAAAGRELRRAHRLWCETTHRRWSHGDPHLANFLYDREHDRAHLIDFETLHETHLGDLPRFADDLLVPLLELCGRVPRGVWRSLATAFLDTYGDPAVIAALASRLAVPTGLEMVLWSSRAGGLGSRELTERIGDFQELVTRPPG